MDQTVDTRPIDFSFNSQESLKEWLKPPADPNLDDTLAELVRIVDFHYNNEGGNLVGLQKARKDLMLKTTDEKMIRRAVVLSDYGKDDNNEHLKGTFELF